MAGKMFSNRIIGATNHSRPVMLVGECPGKQRKKDQNFEVFHGNRTGDFVEKAIDGFTNLILTNACNHQQPTEEQESIGQQDLEKLIYQYKPRRIITLGKIAEGAIDFYIHKGADGLDFKYRAFDHPSYVLRFNMHVQTYFNNLRNEIKKSL